MPRPSIKGEINSLCSPLLLNCIKKVTVKLVLLSLKDKMEFNHFLIQAVQLKFEINIKGVYMWLKKKKDYVYGTGTLHIAALYCQILSIHVQ